MLKLAEMVAQKLMSVVTVSQIPTWVALKVERTRMWVELSRRMQRVGQAQNPAELVDQMQMWFGWFDQKLTWSDWVGQMPIHVAQGPRKPMFPGLLG